MIHTNTRERSQLVGRVHLAASKRGARSDPLRQPTNQLKTCTTAHLAN